MKKRLITFLSLALCLLFLVGCGQDSKDTDVSENEVVEDKVEVEETENGETEEAEKKEESSLGKRSNPVPLRETIRFSLRALDDDLEEYEGEGSLTLNGVIRGEEAYEKLIEYNQFNEEAPEGYEWAILDLTFVLEDLESEDIPYYVYFDINGYGGDGSQTPHDSAVVDNRFGSVDLYKGGTSKGEYAILLPLDDDEALVKVSDWDFDVFMEIK